MVAGSFVLSTFTQTRYDLHEQKVAQVRHISFGTSPFRSSQCFMRDIPLQMTKEEEIGLKRNRRIVNIREEYFVRAPPLS